MPPNVPKKTPEAARKPIVAPVWLHPVVAALAALLLFAAFSKEITDSDFWWHLRTGQYISETHALPDPDPFAYTTAMAAPQVTRHFNLTHEWLTQILLYWTYRVAGIGGIVLGRAALLAIFCALVGFVVYRRTGGFYRAVAATLAAACVAHPFVADRPYLLTFVFLAATVAILESRRPGLLWLLPVIMLLWANCHGGFILGWAVLGAWSLEAVILRQKDSVRLWTVAAVSVLLSGLNPNGFRIVPVLLSYRKSFLTSTIAEWKPPSLWPPTAFSVLLILAALVLVWEWRRVRLADWILFAAFAAAGLAAGRNTFLIGWIAPVVIATYIQWKRLLPALAEFAAAALLLAAAVAIPLQGSAFQLRAANWLFPEGAADFLLSRHIAGHMFNTYEYGGYLIWKLWPQQRVFIDGRAIGESLFPDYSRLLYTADETGAGAQALLDKYGIEVIVMNSFEHTSGATYVLAPMLSESDANPWQVVYADAQATVLMRHPPPGMATLGPEAVLSSMQSECEVHMQHEPDLPGCAHSLGVMFSHTGDLDGARRWLRIYLDHIPGPDPEAQRLYESLLH